MLERLTNAGLALQDALTGQTPIALEALIAQVQALDSKDARAASSAAPLNNQTPRPTPGQKKARAAVAALTPTQKKIFSQICSGKSIEQIAKARGCSKDTVRNHLKVIFRVFGVHSQAALVALAAKRGLI